MFLNQKPQNSDINEVRKTDHFHLLEWVTEQCSLLWMWERACERFWHADKAWGTQCELALGQPGCVYCLKRQVPDIGKPRRTHYHLWLHVIGRVQGTQNRRLYDLGPYIRAAVDGQRKSSCSRSLRRSAPDWAVVNKTSRIMQGIRPGNLNHQGRCDWPLSQRCFCSRICFWLHLPLSRAALRFIV